jgi:hypothetical protein
MLKYVTVNKDAAQHGGPIPSHVLNVTDFSWATDFT